MRIFRNAWLVIGVTLLIFLALECVCFIAAALYYPVDSRADLPVYQDFKEAGAFWIEHDKTWRNLVYAPYHLWNRPPFFGKWTNVDHCGRRVTHYNADYALKEAKKIFLFGGSTLWGTGAPDSQTIPSYLAKFLNQGSSSGYIVSNYGETGFVFSQEINRLIGEIKQGNIPDLVIFYGGINEAYGGAVELGALKTPSYHDYLDRFQRVFKTDKGANLWEIFATTYIYRALSFFKQRIFTDSLARWERRVKREQREEAVRRSAKYWLADYHLASCIGKGYGFKVIFILQPNLYSGKKILRDDEQKMCLGNLQTLNAAYAEIRKIAGEYQLGGFYDLADIFAGISEPIYIDWAHLGPLGNYYIAGKIAEIVRKEGY